MNVAFEKTLIYHSVTVSTSGWVAGGVRAMGALLDLDGQHRSSRTIASVTEQMTQMALAAKNEELERLTSRQHKLLAGVDEVLRQLQE